MKVFDSTLASLADRMIDLHLNVSLEFDASDDELRSAADLLVPNKDGHRWQRLVKSIALNTSVQHPGLTEGAIDFLPPWFSHYFDAVEDISIGYNCVCQGCPYHHISLGSSHTLTQMLRSVCPQVKKVTINGMTYAID
jgi:hypothetical protein